MANGKDLGVTVEAVRAALESVVDPTYGKPMLALGSLGPPEIDGRTVVLSATLSSPADGVREQVCRDIDAALATVEPELEAQVEWAVEVPSREVMGDDPIEGVRNVLLVMSGKGGVGKSTVAANLTLALARSGARVGLLDADIYGPSVPTMMGICGQPSGTDDKRIKPLERFGVKLMSIGFLLEDPNQAIIWRGPMLHGALGQLLTDVAWGELDHLVIDLPPGTGDVALTLAQKLKVTGAVMVTTPQQVALDDVLKGVNMCERLKIPILGVVENMSHFVDSAGIQHAIFGSGGGARLAEVCKAPLLAQIPIEPEVREWGDKGTPVVQAAPGSDAAKTFARLADSLSTTVAQHHFERSGGTTVPQRARHKRLRILR